MNKKILNQQISEKLSEKDKRGAYDTFPDFFRMGTFIDSTHMKI